MRRPWVAVLVAAAGWALCGSARAEDSVVLRTASPGGEKHLTLAPGTTVTAAMQGDGAGALMRIAPPVGPAGERVIIELRGAPLVARGPARLVRAARAAIAAEHGRVIAEIKRLAGLAGGNAGSPAIAREFLLTYNGIATTLSRSDQDALRAHPDVKAIHPDVLVQTALDTSVSFVGAPDFWAAHGYRGSGEVIAVIDTGIDYTHPDLGACVAPGTGCKVIGGYDFQNGDGDPVDDNGHGTHVASIAAGNGALLGVAPDARLLAYKVLDANGFGFSSAIIAGIEAAVDPNGDSDTGDHADVINLSLSGPGDPDDPMSQAVDNATAAGVLVAVAAGNSGGYGTIGSPGVARTALTVGATDEVPNPAYFTSGGPVASGYGLKPEIAAPGVSICAARAAGTALGPTCLDAGHVLLDGTSMATPHVAGAAALLRGIAPGLSPGDIKSLLVQNAVPMSFDPLRVGSGVLFIPAAASAHTVVDFPTLTFGRDDPSQAIWTADRTLTVRNLDSIARSYQLSAVPVSGAIPTGVGITFTPAAFALPAGQSAAVAVHLSVDNALTPDATAPSHAYEAMIELASGAEKQRVPMLFVKSPLLRVHTDQAASLILAHDRTTYYSGHALQPTGTVADLLLPEGTYDVMVVFPGGCGTHVVHEGVVVNNAAGQADEWMSSSEAIFTVSLAMVDETGAPLSDTVKVCSLYHRESGEGITTLTNDPGTPLSVSVSSMSAAYDVDLAALSINTQIGKSYLVTKGVTGISSSHALSNSPAELMRGKVRYARRPGESVSPTLQYLMFVISPVHTFGYGLSLGLNTTPDYDLYVTPAPHPRYRAMAMTGTPQHQSALHRGAVGGGAIEAYSLFEVDRPVYRTTTGDLPVNLGPATFSVAIGNSNQSFSLLSMVGEVASTYLNQGGEGPDAPGDAIGWRLRSGGSVVASGTTPQSSGGGGPLYPAVYTLPAGPYQFETDPVQGWVGGLSATATTRATFDTSRWPGDVNPPYFGVLSVRSEGSPTDIVRVGQAATVRLEVHDAADEAGISVSLFRSAGAAQSSVPITPLGGGIYEAVLSDACPVAGAVDLEIVAVDSSGNEVREWLTPAFACRPDTCGNGTVEPGEACDDGNTLSGDGCNAVCSSTGHCGDGVIDAGEGCDDGNLLDGDCCSATCQPEAEGQACNDASACTTGDTCTAGHCAGLAGPAPAEVDDGVRVAPSGPAAVIQWNPAARATSSSILRGLVSSLPVGPGDGDEACLASDLPLGTTTWTDASIPGVGAGFWYLVRGDNVCGHGPYGSQTGTDGTPVPRFSMTCP
jgi:cysteine-rich repeat protein